MLPTKRIFSFTFSRYNAQLQSNLLINMNCELCNTNGENLLWRNQYCRAILVDDADYPGFCRVVWHDHTKEMTDLTHPQRNELMNIVFAVESAVREIMQPTKINLASLGNMTPHLHWHIIPRYEDDKHFPNPIWASALRDARTASVTDIQARLSSALLTKLNA